MMKRWIVFGFLIGLLVAAGVLATHHYSTRHAREVRQFVADSLAINGLILTSCEEFLDHSINELETIEAKRFTRNAIVERLKNGQAIMAIFKVKDLNKLLNADLLGGNYQTKLVFKTGVEEKDYHVFSIRQNPVPEQNKFFRFSDGRRYKGEWNGALMEGNGLMIYPDGSWYSGSWLSGVAHGQGILYSKDSAIVAEGDWNLGTFSGPNVE
ncbi:MAG: hypothetical protein KDC92_00625 [Bacteroidetes bacterium]|nr:hypothetical protein [Bacteroidota bacterium]